MFLNFYNGVYVALFIVLYLKRWIESLEFFWIPSYIMLLENGACPAEFLEFLTVSAY